MIERICKIPFFKNIDKQLIEDMVRSADIVKRTYKQSATVHYQNESVDGLDIVLKGRAVSYYLSRLGNERRFFQFTQNDIIGANLLFIPASKYPMNIYCLEDSDLLHIKKTAVLDLINEYDFALELIKSISSNSFEMKNKIVMYTQKTLRENLLDYLQALSYKQNSKTVLLPVTKKLLADYFGVQRPSLFRELKKLKDEKIIKIDGRKITIL